MSLLSGYIDTGRILGGPCPSGAELLIGLDGKRYYDCSFSSGLYFQLGCGETNDVPITITQDQWRTHCADWGLSSGTYYSTALITAPGTEFFFILGWTTIGAVGENVWIRYYIDETGTAVPDGVGQYRNDDYHIGLAYFASGFLFACEVIDGAAYAVAWLGSLQLVGPDPPPQYHLIQRLPLEGDEVDLSANSWLDKIGDPIFSASFFNTLSSRGYTNRCSILKHPDGVQVLAYIGLMELADNISGLTESGLISTVCRPDGSNTGMEDVSAAWGVPFDDVGKHLDDGSASVSGYDDYSSPVMASISGNFAEVIFARRDTGSNLVRLRQFIVNVSTGEIIPTAVADFEFVYSPVASSRDITMARRQDGDMHVMVSDGTYYELGGEPLDLPDFCDDFASDGCAVEEVPCVTYWAQCWKITRKDGTVFRFTSLDRDMEFGGETYQACYSLSPAASESSVRVGSIQNVEATGIISSEAITEEDLYGGKFDDAYVEVWLAPWRGSETPRRVASGWIGNMSHSSHHYQAEVLGAGARLSQQALLQTYTPGCRWPGLGQGGCEFDPEAVKRSGEVILATNRAVFMGDLGAESGSSFVDDGGLQWANGRARWLTGRNAGEICEVKTVDFDSGDVVLWALPPFLPQPGDTFELLPGCDMSKTTCKDVYDQYLNFGGYPDVAGEMSINATPDLKY